MKRILLLAFVVVSTNFAFGWGQNGHQIVGKLADQYLTPEARKQIQAILGDETMGQAGLWMDDYQVNTDYKKQVNWHYVYKDKEFADDAVAKLTEFTEVLKNSEAPKEEKLLALRCIIHITGDIHLPIHTGYYKDKGGHKPNLKWEGSDEKTNLHKVWDTDMLYMYNTDVDAYVNELQAKVTAEEKKTWATDDFNQWVTESQELLGQAYDFEGRTIPTSYYEENIVVVNERLAMASVRLANLLNGIFS